MNFYEKNAQSTLTLLEKKGQRIPISRTSNTSDPVTGSVTKQTTSGEIVAVVLPVATTGAQIGTGIADNRLLDELRLGKLRYIIAAALGAPFAPDVNDTLQFEDATWSIIGCTPLNPAGTVLLYKIGVQKI